MRLDEAAAVKVGSQDVAAVYVGSQQVWPTGAPATYVDAVLADSPMGFWLLDETSGTTMSDSSSNARHGTYSGTLTLATTSAPTGHTCPTFSGGYGDVADAAWMDLTAITVEFWFRTSNISTQTSLVSRDNNSGGRPWDISMTAAGAIYAYANNVTGPAILGNATGLDDGQWHHFAWGFANSDLAGWHMVDGVLDKSYTSGGGLPPTSPAPIRIASRAAAGLANWSGQIAGVAIYGSRLSQSLIAAHYAAAS